jgi:quinol monooxygenase YgiN
MERGNDHPDAKDCRTPGEAQRTSDRIRHEDGCISHRWYQDIEDRNVFLLIEEWNCIENLTKHLESQRFGILSGALRTLAYQESVQFGLTLDELDAEIKDGRVRVAGERKNGCDLSEKDISGASS